MKKLFLLYIVSLFFISCSQTSSNFAYMPMPDFKNYSNNDVFHSNLGKSIHVRAIEVKYENQTSQDFSTSVLKSRIDEEMRLLIQKLQTQSAQILSSNGYKVVEGNADYELLHTITLNLKESDITKKDEWLKGEAIKSNLELALNSQISIQGNDSKQINTSTALDNPVSITYANKNADGINFFKTTLSSVPTQVNKELSFAALQLDNVFLKFYNAVLINLNNNLLNTFSQSLEHDKSLQETNTSKKTNPAPSNTQDAQNNDGVTIF